MTNLTEFKGSNLQRFENNGIELYINTTTGESFASQVGYSRMSGRDKSTISRRMQGVARERIYTAQVQTASGIQTVALICEDLIAEWLPKDNPQAATQLIKLGVRGFIHKLAGYEVVSFDPASISRLQILEWAIDSERKYLAEQEKTKLLNQTIEAQAPLVKLAETLTTKEVDTVSVGDLARSYGIGRTTFFEILREINFIQQKPSRQPYQYHIDAGRAEVFRKERLQQPGHFDNVTVITAKGEEYIAKLLTERQQAQQTEVTIEAIVTLQD